MNKLSTKAMLRMDVPPKPDASGNIWLPEFVNGPLRRSVSQREAFHTYLQLIRLRTCQPYYTSSPPSILLTASTTRSAAQNKIQAVEKLHELLVGAASGCIVTPTSEEQKQRVASLVRQEDRRRKDAKMKRGDKKVSRKKGNWD